MSGIWDTVTQTGTYVGTYNFWEGVGSAVALGAASAAATRKLDYDRGETVAGKLSFPEDLYKFSISMCFSFNKYQRRSMFDQPYKKATDVIRLPVAKSITDSFKMNWDSNVQDDPLVGAFLEQTLSTIQRTQGATFNRSTVIDTLLNLGGSVTGTGIGAAVKGATLDIDRNNPTSLTFDKLLQPFGLVTNPFLTVMFKQPEFKKHSFAWKFIPRNPKEARDLNGIIQTFKYHMLPDVVPNVGGTMLTYPDIVNISFYNVDSYLYRFKTCVLESMEVNYAPGAQGPSFFKGSQNVPTEIDLKLNFLEIEYWTKNDLAGKPKEGAGNRTWGSGPNNNP